MSETAHKDAETAHKDTERRLNMIEAINDALDIMLDREIGRAHV